MGFVHTLLRWIFTSWKVNGGPPILDKGQKKGYTLYYAFIIILVSKPIQKLYSSVPQSNCVPCWHQVEGCQVSHWYIKSKNKTKVTLWRDHSLSYLLMLYRQSLREICWSYFYCRREVLSGNRPVRRRRGSMFTPCSAGLVDVFWSTL